MQYVFDKWDIIQKKIIGNNLFIFLDFDGTLTPIVATPEEAVLSESTKKTLEMLSVNPLIKLAFISGRWLDDLKSKIEIKTAIYSGNHGLELEMSKMNFHSGISPQYHMIIGQIKNELEQKISSIQGAFIEDKGIGLTLHYRLVDKQDIPALKTIFYQTIQVFLEKDKLKVKSGKMVLEVQPPVVWDKGKVVLWLLKSNLFTSNNEKVVPVYFGDDVTDEHAFLALRNKGLTIFVGEPQESYAQYYVKNPDEVEAFLRKILEIYNEKISKT